MSPALTKCIDLTARLPARHYMLVDVGGMNGCYRVRAVVGASARFRCYEDIFQGQAGIQAVGREGMVWMGFHEGFL